MKKDQELKNELAAVTKVSNDPIAQIARYNNIANILIGKIVDNAVSEHPKVSLGAELTRALQAVQAGQRMNLDIKKFELDDVLNPRSPKFIKAVSWLIEAFADTLEHCGYDQLQRNQIFIELARRLQGFEERIESALRGVASAALMTVSNPFAEEFVQNLRPTRVESEPAEEEKPVDIETETIEESEPEDEDENDEEEYI